MFFGEVTGIYHNKFIKDAEVKLSEIGKIVKKCWLEIPRHFLFVTLNKFIVRPNHIHGIVIIKNAETQDFAFLRMGYKNKFGPQSKNLSSIIRGFKIGVKKYATINNINFIWQPRFYDRIIRNEKELNRIIKYIDENPLKWAMDRNNPANLYM